MAEAETQEAHTGTQEAAQPSADETRARSMGWLPKEEFRGDESKWRPAEEFIERGENMVPILRDRVRRAELKSQELENSIREFAEYHSKTEQRAYAQAFKDLQTKQALAVQNGDGAGFLAVNDEIAALQRQVQAAPKIKVPQSDPNNDATLVAWQEKNPWYATDRRMNAFANQFGAEIRARFADNDGESWLKAVAAEVKKEFPEKFENPRRNAAAAVEGASQPSKKGGGKGYADMPADARAACDAFVSKYKANGATRDGYVKNFFADQE